MGMYVSNSSRLTVKFLDGDDNSKVLFEVNDRNHLNVGDMFSETYLSNLINQTISQENLPENVTILVVGHYSKMD